MYIRGWIVPSYSCGRPICEASTRFPRSPQGMILTYLRSFSFSECSKKLPMRLSYNGKIIKPMTSRAMSEGVWKGGDRCSLRKQEPTAALAILSAFHLAPGDASRLLAQTCSEILPSYPSRLSNRQNRFCNCVPSYSQRPRKPLLPHDRSSASRTCWAQGEHWYQLSRCCFVAIPP